jgi:hypothetical protein
MLPVRMGETRRTRLDCRYSWVVSLKANAQSLAQSLCRISRKELFPAMQIKMQEIKKREIARAIPVPNSWRIDATEIRNKPEPTHRRGILAQSF